MRSRIVHSLCPVRRSLAIVLAVCWAGLSVAAAAIVPVDRLPVPGTWESAGVEGGIPNRTTICADVTKAPYNADNTGVVSAVGPIAQAIANCPSGQVVYIPAGNYLIDSYQWDNLVALRKSITLRGAGPSTVFKCTASGAIAVGLLGPWPPPKANAPYEMPVLSGSSRGSTTVTVADTSKVAVGRMIMIDEEDDPSLVWTRSGVIGRFRATMHMVDSKTGTTVTFHPPLQIDFVRNPQLSWWPDLTTYAGIEDIKFVGTGSTAFFIDFNCAWNCWVKDCEFTNMYSKTIRTGFSGHLEIRGNYLHDQASGGPNSEGIDLFCDTSWSLIVDNICVAAGYPQINIGDSGSTAYYSGGMGNVIAYNYAVDSFYLDPPTQVGKLTSDISTNHSPHNQFNLVEGNIAGSISIDGYHGSGSHSLIFRNLSMADTRWTSMNYRTAIQIDRRNLYYSVVGNVLGEVGKPTKYEFAEDPTWTVSTIYRLGFPDMGNESYSGTFPPTPANHGDGGPRDLYVLRNNTTYGTTILEGNWDSVLGRQDWTIPVEALPNSYFLSAKPEWFGTLSWPPIDPAHPVTNDPSIIPAGYRYVHGALVIPKRPHPADLNGDFTMTIDEATKYGVCWKSAPAVPSGCSANSTLDNAVRAATIWTGSPSGGYFYDSTKTCPLCWSANP